VGFVSAAAPDPCAGTGADLFGAGSPNLAMSWSTVLKK
jgi:hypothetical protein